MLCRYQDGQIDIPAVRRFAKLKTDETNTKNLPRVRERCGESTCVKCRFGLHFVNNVIQDIFSSLHVIEGYMLHHSGLVGAYGICFALFEIDLKSEYV